MKNAVLVYILGAYPNLPVNQVFKISDYEGLSNHWTFKPKN